MKTGAAPATVVWTNEIPLYKNVWEGILVGRSTSQETCRTCSFISSGWEKVKRSVKDAFHHLRSFSRSAIILVERDFCVADERALQILTTP